MKKVQQALLSLLKAGLWDREIDDKSQFPLSAVEWERLFLLARQQTVAGIVFRGIESLPDHFMPSVVLLAKWMIVVDDIEKNNRKMNKAIVSLVREFSKLEVIPVLQKGQGVALLYEEPLLRESGDIDFCFNSFDERRKVENHIADLGIKINRRPDGSSCYKWKGIVVEHHDAMLDFKNRSICKLLEERKKQKVYELVRITEDCIFADVYVPCPEMNILMLNFHILKHVMGHGVGLRQLCDLARAYHSHAERIDWKLLSDACKSAGIGRWNRLLHSVLTREIGMDMSLLDFAGLDVSDCDCKLMDVVWSGGNFGQHRTGKEIQGKAGRKLLTFAALFSNLAFGLKYAPAEYIEYVSSLVAGQFGRKN